MAASERTDLKTNPEIIDDGYLRDPDPHQKQVENFLRPLEAHWDLIRDVLLWKKPVFSLFVFVAVNGIFCYFATGNFRVFLIGSIVVGLSLCVEELRSQVAGVLERAGITPEERESYEASLIYQRFCYKLALIWGFVERQLSKLRQLKERSDPKYYVVLVVLFVTAAFTYQYLPWLKIFYCTFLFLYLWPPAKYHGTHRVVIGVVEPFLKPFITHWKHSRTKRQRDQLSKAQNGENNEEDSEDEFTKEYNPQLPKRSQNTFDSAPSTEDHEKAPLLDNVDISSQLIDLTPQQDQEDSSSSSSSPDLLRLDLPGSSDHNGTDLETPGGSSVSFNSSSSIIPDSREFPSVSPNTDNNWEFEDDDFAQGLEFPDIEGKDYHSSNESLNASNSDEKKQSSTSKEQSVEHKPVYKEQKTQNQETSSSTADGSDFELLDKSEIDDMDQTLNEERPSSSLGTVGKWLGL